MKFRKRYNDRVQRRKDLGQKREDPSTVLGTNLVLHKAQILFSVLGYVNQITNKLGAIMAAGW